MQKCHNWRRTFAKKERDHGLSSHNRFFFTNVINDQYWQSN